jgi:hypothetical protein
MPSETYSTVEALAMVIVVESFYPAISGLNRETTSKALSCEQLVPICNQVYST